MVDPFGRIKMEPDGHRISVQRTRAKTAADERPRYLSPMKL